MVINPKKLTIGQFITEHFRRLGIRINMVFFTPEGKPDEIERARYNFAPALKGLDPPGSFVTADNLGELKQTLRRGIRQKLTYQIFKPDKPPDSADAVEVTEPGAMDNWSKPLAPGIYTLRVVADKTYSQEIDLKKGDRLIVNLVEGPDGGIDFQRALYGDDSDEFQNTLRADTGDWRLAVLRNKKQPRAQADRMQIFTSLERKHVELTPDRIQQIRPRFAWFQLGAEDRPHPEREFTVRWHERIFYPGPVWHFDVPKWVKDLVADAPAKPTLTAWWCEPGTRLTVGGVFPLNPPGNTTDLPHPVDEQSGVIIESIGVEDHQVEVWPDAPEPKSCLVVRMKFPTDNPYIVDPYGFNGLEIVGYEHRLYREVGKYTGLFWSINRDELEKLSGLRLISLNALRAEAGKQKNFAEVKLSEPRVEDQIPDPKVPVVKAN
jgi:hypothetical protein